MAINNYKQGQPVLVFATFNRADTGALVNPTNKKLFRLKPDGTEDEISAGAIINPTTGRFEYVEAGTHLSGDWEFRWEADGPDNNRWVFETKFHVHESEFAAALS